MTAPEQTSDCTVFIVEDSDIIVARMTNLLADATGVRFLGNAGSVNAAYEILACENPDVMILDINLGTEYPVNGIQLLSIVRKAYPKLKIMMFTNHSGASYRRLCMDVGADYFFDKSADSERIIETLQQIHKLKNET